MLTLRPQQMGTFLARHPWVLAKSLVGGQEFPGDGEVVEVAGPNGKFLARGIYNSRSHIRIRLYSWKADEQLDETFWRRRLATAIQLRRELGYDDRRGAARLVFSEADGLSGLIVDRYGDYLVVQVAAMAIGSRLSTITGLLAELVEPRGILVRTDAKIAQAEGLEPQDGLVWGELPPVPLTVRENEIDYSLDVLVGQKTGMYLDQRENRRAAARYFAGRKVLDVCCYMGGFSLTAAKLGGATEVIGVDASERAVQTATANAAANGISNVRFEVGECFETLEQRRDAGEKFGGI
ncbi:MAG TPA: methyltransferase domain-containing protein, partial [Pirellulaceae bacterium]|nr:methyltransferase domain-containing protein [Pirellulaceae bacterium]